MLRHVSGGAAAIRARNASSSRRSGPPGPPGCPAPTSAATTADGARRSGGRGPRPGAAPRRRCRPGRRSTVHGPLRLRTCPTTRPAPSPMISATGPGGEAAAAVHDDHVGAGLLDFAEQVAGHDHGPPPVAPRTGAGRRASRGSAAGPGRSSARRGPAGPAGRAWPGRWPAAGSCPASRCAPAGRSRRPRPGDLQHLRPGAQPPPGRPVARQYRSRLARPDRCGRKPGPSTNEPEPGQRGRAGPDPLAEDR